MRAKDTSSPEGLGMNGGLVMNEDLGMKANRVSGSGIWTAIGLAVVSAVIGSVLLLTEVMLHPPASDLTAWATFLAVSGASTLALGLGLRKFRFPPWLRSLRARVISVTVLTTTLALINVGFTKRAGMDQSNLAVTTAIATLALGSITIISCKAIRQSMSGMLMSIKTLSGWKSL